MAGSFHVKTKDGPQGRIGVMPFREQVSTVDVANMFGREMGYPTFTETLAPMFRKKKLEDRTFEWLVSKSQSDPVSSSPRTALLALLRQEVKPGSFPLSQNKNWYLRNLKILFSFLNPAPSGLRKKSQSCQSPPRCTKEKNHLRHHSRQSMDLGNPPPGRKEKPPP